jgi:uncharacterized membrane protein
MAIATSKVATGVSEAQPLVSRITPADLVDVLAKGLTDFMAVPTFAIFLILIYPFVGLTLLRLTFGYNLLPLVFPLAAGFPLIGPFAGIGLYELSRRREQGLDISWQALSDFHIPCIRGVILFGVLLAAIFFAWLGAAMVIYQFAFGTWVPATVSQFVQQVFTTPAGWTLIVVGCAVGFAFAVVAFSISVVSIPLLLDKDVSLGTAIQTSVRAVVANPVTMAMWALIIVAALVIGSIPFFFGLAIALPVLGHSTWHLYRKVVTH